MSTVRFPSRDIPTDPEKIEAILSLGSDNTDSRKNARCTLVQIAQEQEADEDAAAELALSHIQKEEIASYWLDRVKQLKTTGDLDSIAYQLIMLEAKKGQIPTDPELGQRYIYNLLEQVVPDHWKRCWIVAVDPFGEYHENPLEGHCEGICHKNTLEDIVPFDEWVRKVQLEELKSFC